MFYRYSNSVKHFALTCDGETYNFGIAEFESLEDLLDHFSCLPVIGAETGNFIDNCLSGRLHAILHII